MKLLQGDCLELMKDIPDGSIDMILADLPYGTTACEWDSIIPVKPLWEQYKRVIKSDGAIVLTTSQPFTSFMVMSNPDMFREEVIWLKNKSGNGFQAKQKHMKVHESILVFSKNGKYTFNPQKWLVAEKEFLTQRKTFKEVEVGNNIYGKMKRTQKKDTGERNPVSIVSERVPFTPQKNKKYGSDVDLRYHPTQKPVALMEYLIKTYADEGDTVLDNVMGSGTTGIACLNTNRNFIGIELDETYFNIAKDRIKNHTHSK